MELYKITKEVMHTDDYDWWGHSTMTKLWMEAVVMLGDTRQSGEERTCSPRQVAY